MIEILIDVSLVMVSIVLGACAGKLISELEYKDIIETYKETCTGWEQLVKDMRKKMPKYYEENKK